MFRPANVVVSALSIAVVAAVAMSASATPGAGGWGQLGHGSTATAPSLNGSVSALKAVAPGTLYVGGTFTAAGGVAGADYIAKWSGGTWSALGSQKLNGAVNAIAVQGSKVYVGGVFTKEGTSNIPFLAVWDGTQWGSVCSGPVLNASVDALQIVGGTIYVGGTFKNGANVAKADDLLACDLATGAPRTTVQHASFNGTVYALAADSKGTLYAGGTFSALDGNANASFVAYLAAGSWHAMTNASGGKGVTGIVRSLGTSGTAVYVGTDSLNVGGIPAADHVARWNGSNWNAMGSNGSGDGWFPASTYIYAFATYGSLVYAAGSFANAGGSPLADSIAYFDAKTWRPVGSNGAGNGPLGGQVSALAVLSRQLYAGGTFTSAGGNLLAQHVASTPLPVVGH